jgi:hypothetical protein
LRSTPQDTKGTEPNIFLNHRTRVILIIAFVQAPMVGLRRVGIDQRDLRGIRRAARRQPAGSSE